MRHAEVRCIELTIDKEMRKNLDIHDGASSVFACEAYLIVQPQARTSYPAVEFTIGSKEGDLSEIISDFDLGSNKKHEA